MLKDEHEDVREYAAFTISDMGQKAVQAVTALTAALSDPVWYVRASVAWVLGEIGTGARYACSSLITCLTDNEIEVRISAARALGMISSTDNKDVIIALEKMARDNSQPPEAKEKAREALVRVRSSGSQTKCPL